MCWSRRYGLCKAVQVHTKPGWLGPRHPSTVRARFEGAKSQIVTTMDGNLVQSCMPEQLTGTASPHFTPTTPVPGILQLPRHTSGVGNECTRAGNVNVRAETFTLGAGSCPAAADAASALVRGEALPGPGPALAWPSLHRTTATEFQQSTPHCESAVHRSRSRGAVALV